jgi:hypothetical protein
LTAADEDAQTEEYARRIYRGCEANGRGVIAIESERQSGWRLARRRADKRYRAKRGDTVVEMEAEDEGRPRRITASPVWMSEGSCR